MQMPDDFAALRRRLWRAYAALQLSLRQLQRSQPMVQGSFYLQHRRCGKPNCRCSQGHLHPAWVITRSQGGQSRTFMVPAAQRGRLRQLTAEYRRYQRARAVLVKRHQQMLEMVDAMAEGRMIGWPEKPLTQEPP